MTQREQYKQAKTEQAIPAAVTEITIRRSDYNDTVHVVMKSGLWEAKFSTTEGDMYTRIHEIAAEMERTPR